MKIIVCNEKSKTPSRKIIKSATNTSGIPAAPSAKLYHGSLDDMIDAFNKTLGEATVETSVDISGGLFKILEDITDEIEAQLGSRVQDISFEHDDENLYIIPHVVEQAEEITIPLKDIIFDGTKIMENVDAIMKRIEEVIPEE